MIDLGHPAPVFLAQDLPGYAAVADANTIVISRDGQVHTITMKTAPKAFRAVQSKLAAQAPFAEIAEIIFAPA